MNTDENRRGYATVTETNNGGSPAVIYLDQASASIRPTFNRGMNRANLVSRSEKNKERFAKEALLA